ncbi:MAG: hypothetical protein ACREX7_09730 [Casimicrobiaceae bacterium]
MRVPSTPFDTPDLAPPWCESLGRAAFAPWRMHTPGPIPPIDDEDDDEDDDRRGGGGGGNIDPDDDEVDDDDDDDDEGETHWATGPSARR